MASLDERVPTGFLANNFLDSILAGIRQELGASHSTVTSRSLEIDGIRRLQNVGGRFIYRLLLSDPIDFTPDQVLDFRTRQTKQTISATVIRSDDDGLVIESDQPLPTDAKLINVTFDPAFIYRALGDYLSDATATPIARKFLGRRLTPIPDVEHCRREDLNVQQSSAIDEMTAVPIHLLWGPPGTGKTTTLAAAISEWLGQGKTVLVVSTSNAAVDVAMRSILKFVDFHPSSRSAL